jgi:predicted dehydrogenase
MARTTRRDFLEHSLLASAAALAPLGMRTAVARDEVAAATSANERLGVAVVGVNGRGGSHLVGFSNPKLGTEVVAICDVDEKVGQKRCEEVEKRFGKRPAFFQDIRKLLEAPGIDVISIATPNHWHALGAIWAVQHGKDVYVEKPVSHNVLEGRRIVDAARKHNRIVQTGTQSRSNPGMRSAIAFLHGGGIGKISLARGLCYKRRNSIGPRGSYDAPKHVDYDLWCGPAPIGPITRPSFHYDWHWQWDFGNGDLGNQGIHQMDIARWGLGVSDLGEAVFSYGGRFGYEDAGETANTQVCVHTYGDKTLEFRVRGLPTDKEEADAGVGVIFYGSEGKLVIPSYSGGIVLDPKGREVRRFDEPGDDANHYGNFVAAVRSRSASSLNSDIEEGHLSSALCHLGNISYRLGERISMSAARERIGAVLPGDVAANTFTSFAQHLKANSIDLDKTPVQFGAMLTLDGKAERFTGGMSGKANPWLSRVDRKGFEIPSSADAV